MLHNFIWHERWTWRDRAGLDKSGWWKRLLRFQIANGALSVGGNLALMLFLVGTCGINDTLANVVHCLLLHPEFSGQRPLGFYPCRARVAHRHSVAIEKSPQHQTETTLILSYFTVPGVHVFLDNRSGERLDGKIAPAS